MPNLIEQKGVEILIEWLKEQGRTIEKSDNKTFDLKVDGKYVEVKTKSKPYAKLDFLSFTDKQFREIKREKFSIFLICNVGNPSKAEIYEFCSELLKSIEPKKYTSHEYNKSILDSISISQKRRR